MKKIPVLIDCDTGIDDIVALALALNSEKLDVKGITTVAGNQKLNLTTYNTLNALELMRRTDIPLAKGADKPLNRDLLVAGEIHGDTGLGTYTFKQPTTKEIVKEDAVEFMYNVISESEEPLVILALGPLTNIALLLEQHSDIKDKIDKILFMGGSIRTGNPTPVATFNVLVDPEAARYVLKSNVPFHMVPLDTTNEAYLTTDELEKIVSFDNPVAAMIDEVTKFYFETVETQNNAKERFKGLSIHDLVTVVYLTNPELFTTVNYYGDVETKGELTTGFTMIDYENTLRKPESEKNIVYVDSVDREGYVEVFYETLGFYNK